MNKKIFFTLLILITVFSFLGFSLNVQAATSGPNNPSAGADDSSVGTIAWSNPGNVVSSNNTYATAGLNDNQISHYIKATGFGFSIPSGSTINGITAEIEKNSSNASRIQDYRVRIIKGGAIGATDKANANWWGTSDAYTTYGGSSDLWGETWTYSDVNSANFGIAISAYKNTAAGNVITASVDHIRITIAYTLANTAPNAPALISPANGSSINDNTPALSANYSDPDAGDTGTTNYRIATSALNCTSGTVVASGTSAETASNNQNTTWTPGSSIGVDATYYWCAQNNDGVATSAWTSMGNFILDTTAPVLSFTDNVEAGPVLSDTITATWGDATVKKWNYDIDTTCSTTAGDYPYTDVDSMDQSDETNNTKFVCLYGEDALGNKTTLVSANDINIAPPDTTPPSGPTNLASSDHTVSVWSNDDTITMIWTPAVDSGSGLFGYSYIFDTSETTDPDTIEDLGELIATVNSDSLLGGDSHYFHIRAVDVSGNWGNAVYLGPFFIDNTLPDTSITDSPSSSSSNASPSFSFEGSDADGSGVASFECKLNAESFSSCASPKSYADLDDGSHTFQARAIDNVGNTDSTPASYTWSIDTDAPTVSSITRVNSSPTNASSVDFTVTFSELVSDIETDDFSLTENGVSGSSVTSVSDSSGSSVTVTVDTGSDDGTIRLDVLDTATIADAAENNVSNIPFTSGEVYDINKSALTLNITASSVTNISPIPVSIEFSESVEDFVSTGINLSSGTVDAFAGSETNYTFNISSPNEGPITITVPAGVAHDSASNGNLLTTLEITYDIIPPTIIEVTPIPALSNNINPSYTFNSTEAGNITYGGSCGSGSLTIAAVGNNTATFNTLANGFYPDCTIIVTDTAGNPSESLAIPTFEVDSNLPVTKLAVSCVSSVFTVGTDINCTVTRLNASDVEVTSGTNEVNLSSDSGTASFDQTSLTIASGSSSADFQYTDAVAGSSVITASSPEPSISSGSFSITASRTPIVSTRINMTLDESNVCTNSVIQVTLQAVDDDNNADTLLDGYVMLSTTGSATPNTFSAHLSGGFAQINIADSNPETIQISITDADTGKIIPSALSATFRTCGGGGGGTPTGVSATSVSIGGSVAKASGGTINVYGVNVAGGSTANLVPLNLAVKQNADGSFIVNKESLPANFPALGIQYVDAKGNKAPLMLYNSSGGNINIKSINIPPTVSVADDHFAFYTYVRGYSKGNSVTLYADGKEYKTVDIKTDGSYEIQLSADKFSAGEHSFYIEDNEKSKSLEQTFQIVKTRIPRADVNKDGKVDISDFSAFNSTFLYAKNGGKLSDSLKKKFDFNKNGLIDQGDLSIMLQAFNR